MQKTRKPLVLVSTDLEKLDLAQPNILVKTTIDFCFNLTFRCSVWTLKTVFNVKSSLMDLVEVVKVSLEISFRAALDWVFDETDYSQFQSSDGSSLSYKDIFLEEYLLKVKSLKNRKNFASGSSGANVLTDTNGIVNRAAILKSDPTVYMTIEECNG